MDPTTHGTGRLYRFSGFKLSNFLVPDKGTNFFPLGTNLAPGDRPPTYSPLDRRWIGEIVEVNGERVESPDYGGAWVPSEHPGMAITFGYSGSGKGGLLIPGLLSYGGSIMVNDPKGELAHLTSEWREQTLGQKVANCDPFGEVQKGYGDKLGIKSRPAMRYNPLAALAPDTDDFAERVATVAEALAIDTASGGNPLFAGTGRDAIEGVIAAEATMRPNKATLREVRRWLTLAAPDFAAAVTAYLSEFPSGLAASKLRGFTDMTNRTNQSTLITAKEQTKFLDNENIVRYFEPDPGEPTFSFDELADGHLTVYVVLPGRLLGAYSGFSRLMFNQALEAVQRVRKENLKLPVAFLMDEAGTSIGRLESVEQAYGLARGAGAVLWSFYQDLPQLKGLYPHTWGSFLGNSSCVTVTGARDEETCEYISKWLGPETVKVTGTNQGQGPGGASSGTSTGATGRPLMYPDEVRSMDPRDLLVLMPTSMGNYRQSKLVYHRDPRFNGKYRPDPKYPTSSAPAPYPVGPFAPPTLEPPKRDAKPPMGIIGRCVVAFLVITVGGPILALMHLSLLSLLLTIAAIWWIFKGGEKPHYQPGGWWIEKLPNGVGQLVGYVQDRG